MEEKKKIPQVFASPVLDKPWLQVPGLVPHHSLSVVPAILNIVLVLSKGPKEKKVVIATFHIHRAFKTN